MKRRFLQSVFFLTYLFSTTSYSQAQTYTAPYTSASCIHWCDTSDVLLGGLAGTTYGGNCTTEETGDGIFGHYGFAISSLLGGCGVAMRDEYQVPFTVSQSGIYEIKITARVNGCFAPISMSSPVGATGCEYMYNIDGRIYDNNGFCFEMDQQTFANDNYTWWDAAKTIFFNALKASAVQDAIKTKKVAETINNIVLILKSTSDGYKMINKDWDDVAVVRTVHVSLVAGKTYYWALRADSHIVAACVLAYTQFAGIFSDISIDSVRVTYLNAGNFQTPFVSNVSQDPSTVFYGDPVTLSADVVARTPNSSITAVEFYYDSNGNGTYDSNDIKLGAGTKSGSQWSMSTTANFKLGRIRYFSRALDSNNVWSDACVGYGRVEPAPAQQGNMISISSYDWDDSYGSGNENGVIETGEDIKLRLKLKSTVGLDYIMGYLSSSLGNMQISDNEVQYPPYSAGDSAWPYGSGFDMLLDLDSDYTVPFTLYVEYCYNNQDYYQTFTFNKTFYKKGTHTATFQIASYTVDDSTTVASYNNGDGIIQGGEKVIIRPLLKNIGTAAATGIEAWLAYSGTLFDVGTEADSETYPDLNAGEQGYPVSTAVSSGGFTIRDISRDASGSYPVDLHVASDQNGDGIVVPDALILQIEPAAWLRLSKKIADFGVAVPGAVVTQTVQIANVGVSALTIRTGDITTSASDTTFAGVSFPLTLAGGQSTNLLVLITTANLQGQISRWVKVESTGRVRWPGDDNVLTIGGLVSSSSNVFKIENSTNATDPDISDNWIVWCAAPNGNYDVFAYCLTNGSIRQITCQTNNQSNPFVSGNLIAWSDARHRSAGTDGYSDIYAYDLAHPEYGEMLVAPAISNGKQSIVGVDGNLVVYKEIYEWLYSDTSPDEVFNIVVRQYNGNGTFTTRYQTGWTAGVGNADRNSIQGDIDFNEGLLTYSKYVLYKYTSSSTGRTSWQYKESYRFVFDFAAGDSSPRSLSGDSYDSPIVASAHRFLYTKYSSEDDKEIWQCTNAGVISKVYGVTDFDVGDQFVTVGGNASTGVVAFDYRGSKRPGLYWIDCANGNSEGVIVPTSGAYDVRGHGYGIVWEDTADGGTIKYTFLKQPDVQVTSGGITFSSDTPVEGQPVHCTVQVRNLTGYGQAGTITVNLFNGDPDNGGTVLANAQTFIGLSANSSKDVVFSNLVGLVEGTHPIYARVTVSTFDPVNNNTAFRTITVQDGDIQKPTIANIVVTDINGDGDGIVGEDERLRISWTAEDASGIVGVSLTVDGIPVATQGVWYAETGPLSVGVHTGMVSVTDGDLSPETRVVSFTFDVINCERISVAYGNTVVVDGQSMPVDLGTFVLGETSSPLLLTVRNYGAQRLDLGALTVTGALMKQEPDSVFIEAGENTVFHLTPSTAVEGVFTGTVSLASSDLTHSPFTFKVRYVVSQSMLSVSPSNRSVGWLAASTTFNVTNTGSGTMAWTAAVTAGGAWARITSGASGNNDGTVTVAYDANSSNDVTRTATIRVIASGAKGSPVDITVTQEGNSASSGDPFGTPSTYATTPMTILVKPALVNVAPEDGDFVAAFVEGELRAQTEVIKNGDCYFANLTVQVAENGENIVFKYYDASADKVLSGDATISSIQGGSAGTLQDPFVINFGVTTQRLSLIPGWNHVSFNVQPVDATCSIVFSGISNVLQKVIGKNKNYTPGWGLLNTLQQMEDGIGYWIKVSSACILEVEGVAFDLSRISIPLSVGWNNIAYLGAEPVSVDDALTNVMLSVEKVIGEGKNYTPGWGILNTLTTMNPGVGYWIKMSASNELHYGSATTVVSAQRIMSTSLQPVILSVPAWVAVQPEITATPHALLLSATVNGISAAADDILGVFVDGQCRAVATAQMLNGIAYFNATVLMGSAGETATFKLYDASADGVLISAHTEVLTPGSFSGSPDNPLVVNFESIPIYVATFVAAGGTPATTNIAQTYGSSYILPAQNPTRTGYTFNSWTNSAGATVTGTTTYQVTGDTALYAKWTANTYTVSYNGNGSTGGSTASSTHTYDVQKALTANGFTKTGYVFSGWTNTVGTVYADGVSVLNLASVQGATVMLMAVWSAGTSIVTLDPNSGSGGTASITAMYDQGMPVATAPTRVGYTFAGYWDTSAASGGTQYYDAAMTSARAWNKVGAQTLWARWTAKTYTATFNAGSGTPAQQAVDQTYDRAYILPSSTPVRTGYTFAGWFTAQNGEGTQVTTSVHFQTDGAVTLYAKWAANAFSVRFNKNNASATGAMADQTFTYDQAQALTANTFRSTGQRMIGWSTIANGTVAYTDGTVVSNLTATANGVVNLYALWVDDQIVYFDAQGGTTPIPASIVVTNDFAYGPLSVTTREGYTFSGWFTATNGLGTLIVSNTLVSESHSRTLYADWTANTYTTTFVYNNGTPGSEATNQTYDALYHLPAVVPEAQTGFYFTGWWTELDGGAEVTAGSTVKITADSTFYGHWTNLYTVVLDAQGGSVTPSNKVVNYGALYGELPTPLRNGYGFDGWWTLPSHAGAQIHSDSLVSITATQTLYAAWTNLPVTVTFDPGTGAVDHAVATVFYDQPYGALPIPLRTGYTFTNWILNVDGAVTAVTNETVVALWTNHVLVAGWSNNVYTLTFDPDGGTVSPPAKQIVYDTPYGTLPRPHMTGFVSRGWTNSVGEMITAQTVVTVTNDFTVYPKWEVSYEVPVTLDPQGGFVTPSNITYETGVQITYSDLPDPVRDGFRFTGWYSSWTNHALIVTNGSEFLAWDDHTLYAKWVGTCPPAGGALNVATNGDGTAVLQYSTNHLTGVLMLDRVPNTPDGAPIVTIGASGFFQQAGLTDLQLGIFVTNVGTRAFAYCNALTNVFLQRPINYVTGAPDALTIGNGAFMYCTSLRQVVFPDGLVRIGVQAFDGCLNLTRLYFEGSIANPATLIASANAFRGVAQANGGVLELYYRDSSVSNAFATIQATLQAGGVSLRYTLLAMNDDVYDLATSGIATLPPAVTRGNRALQATLPMRKVDVRFAVQNTLGKSAEQVMATILDQKQVVVLYWTNLQGDPAVLTPIQVIDHENGSATALVEVPAEVESGFFKVLITENE